MRERWEILSDLINANGYTRVAEVGVSRGINASEVLKLCPQIEFFYLVDITFDVLDKGLFENNWSKVKLYDAKWGNLGWLKEVDLVFIDADHSYEAVKKDIETWKPIVRKGGIISGHDYLIDHDQPNYGVTLAIDEVFPNKNLEQDTLEDGKIYVWWVKK